MHIQNLKRLNTPLLNGGQFLRAAQVWELDPQNPKSANECPGEFEIFNNDHDQPSLGELCDKSMNCLLIVMNISFNLRNDFTYGQKNSITTSIKE